MVLECAHFARGCANVHARLKPRHHHALVAIVYAIVLWCECLSVRHPELDPRIGIVKPVRQHANDGGRNGVQVDLLADDGGITGKAALEETPGEQDPRGSALG